MTNPTHYPRILIIAGSDSGGGAGIQADIKTCAAFGVYSATAITAVTAQNTLGVQAVEALSPAMVTAQIESVLTDIGADVVKIGMLANREIIDAVADSLEQHAPDISIVLDPVMVATSGDKLLDDDAIDALKTRLIPMAEVITPNAPEAAALTGLPCEDLEELQEAGHALLKLGAFSALMKGGHLDTGAMMHDLLVTEDSTSYMSGPKIRSRHTHGTGCTLASALACGLALGESLEDAAQTAKDFVYDAIKNAPKLGSGGKGTHGPLNHGLNSVTVSPDASGAQ